MSDDLLSLLYRAFYAEGPGIVVKTSSPERLRQRLYPLRKANEELKILTFSPSPTQPDELWIWKNDKKKG